MTAVSPGLYYNPYAPAMDAAFAPIPGAKLNFYASNSDTRQDTFANQGMTIKNANPVVALQNGLFPVIFLSGLPYKVVFTDANDNEIWTEDPFTLWSASIAPWAVAAGTVDAITATYDPSNATLTDGLLLTFRAFGANVTTVPTFAPDGLTAHIITTRGGQPLQPGDIAGDRYEALVRYNLARGRWELLNPAVVEPPWAVATGTADAILATYSPPNAALWDGLTVSFRASAANATTTPTFSPDGLTAHTITKQGGTALSAGDIPAALAEVSVRYNLTNTRWELLNPATVSGVTALALPGMFVNLQITNNAALPNIKGDLTATRLSVSNGVQSINLSSVSVSINISNSGANGLDTGVVAASSLYAVYVIYNPTTTTTAGLFSLSGTAPTLPSGYTYYSRFGWMITDAGNSLLRTLQKGMRTQYYLPPLRTLISGASGDPTVPTWTAVTVAGFVPTTASSILLVLSSHSTNHTSMVAPNNSYGALASTVNPPPMSIATTSGQHTALYGEFTLESTNVYYAAAGADNRLQCLGWLDNL